MTRIAFLLAFAFAACGSGVPVATAPFDPAAVTPLGQGAEVDADGLRAALEGGKVGLLLDVRTTGEFSGDHVPGALNIPIDELPARVGELAAYKGQPVYVICRSGRRSLAGQNILEDAGHTAVNVAGGTVAWKTAGYAVE